MSCDILLANGKDSFEAALAREPFDLIISDYNLPGYDGITALKQAQATQPDVPVILVSGTVGEEQAVKCLQIGATDYLLKERLDRLAPAVQRAIQEAETRRTRKRAEAALGAERGAQGRHPGLGARLHRHDGCRRDGDRVQRRRRADLRLHQSPGDRAPARRSDHPAARSATAHTAGLARYLATGEGPLLGKVIEITAVRSDGSELPVELAITAIRSENGPDIHRCVARHHGTQARRRDPRPPGRDCRLIGRRDLQHGHG